jgi:hypothetical protein
MTQSRTEANLDKMEKIAVQFKNVGEQKEGMRLYTQYIMQDKTFKSLELVI